MTDEPTQCLSERALLQVNLPEAQYQADMVLFNDGQKLSAELLKLSLAGIAVVGALLSFPDKAWPDDLLFKIFLSSSVAVLAIAAGTALLQRFYASSAMFHHIKAMKVAAGGAVLEQAVEAEIAIRAEKFKCAHALLVTTSVCLVLGAALLGSAFIRQLFAA